MAWVALIFAGICEVFGIKMLHEFHRKKKLQTVALIFVSFGGSFFLLSYAMQVLPMGLSYATWTGIGTSGGALVGIFAYKESKSWQRVGFIALIVMSVIGLKLST